MRRVSQRTIVDHWLASESRKPGVASIDPASLDDDGALDRLLRLKPGAASFLWREAPIDWYRVRLTGGQLRRLRVIGGPPRSLWGALSPDGTVDGAARRVESADPRRLAKRTGVDVPRIVRLADEASGGGDGGGSELPDLVCFARRPWVRPFVADGNHRAVAAALALRRGDPYRPLGAYLGVGRNRPRGAVAEAVRSLLWAVRTRVAGRDEPNGF
ncbi:hypothetical protein [Halegenticoccus tardaugens]|uniref:hypothetical protein n=1 Tax=Halegenticoccus tardaugens TaxID=2071624 RepID=UPI00100A60C0|nr:hypothetical protein [Halegenticoccus tardaugens]